jgi:hypothetical protein
MQTLEIAADRGNGAGQGAGQEVIERLLFHRIDMLGRNPAIGQAIECAVLILPNPANAPPAWFDPAAVSAESADDRLIFCLIEKRFFHRFQISLTFREKQQIVIAVSTREIARSAVYCATLHDATHCQTSFLLR